MSKLTITPITFAEASAYVQKYHRHHPPPIGCKFAVGVSINDVIVGVCIVGRPVARHNDDSYTLEVTRLCTDGTPNACSKLYSAAWRAARALGYRKMITYILDTESGASVRGAGWVEVAKVRGRSWHCKSRPRVDKHPTQGKLRFEIMEANP